MLIVWHVDLFALIMKNILKAISISFVLLSCNAQEVTIEDNLYSCMVNHYKENKIDLPASLDTLENYLIEKNVLQSKDAKSKIKFYEVIIETGEIPGIEITRLMEKLRESYPIMDSLKKCVFTTSNLDSAEYIKTKFYLTSQKIRSEFNETHTVSPVSVSKAMLLYLTVNDFDQPYYRAQMLLSYVMVAERDKAFTRKIQKHEAVDVLEGEGGFVIDFSDKNELLVNGNNLKIENLEPFLLKYLHSFDKSTHVQLIFSRKTEYDYFEKIHKYVEDAYLKFWGEVSLKEYSHEFHELSAIEQNKIKSRYPKRIIETLQK